MNCNFGLIFGMSFKKFSQSVLEVSWSHERIKTFIEEKSLEGQVELIAEKYPVIDPTLWDYYAVATHIRDQFFDTYKGLMERIKRNEAFAKEHGYIRSFHGAIRRLPMLPLCSKEIEGKYGNYIGMRTDEDFRNIANLINITSNTSIQSDESITVMRRYADWLREDNPFKDKALIIGFVHDSVDALVEREGAMETIMALKANFETQEPWQKGITFPTDCMVVDLKEPNHYYKHGWKFKKFKDLQKSN
jgi:hypothetical protein